MDDNMSRFFILLFTLGTKRSSSFASIRTAVGTEKKQRKEQGTQNQNLGVNITFNIGSYFLILK